jgi:hypothetical protein
MTNLNHNFNSYARIGSVYLFPHAFLFYVDLYLPQSLHYHEPFLWGTALPLSHTGTHGSKPESR